MSLELTENKSNIGSGALNDLVFILYCRVIGQWLLTSRQSVDISWGAIGNRLAIGRRLYFGRAFLIAESLQLFGDQSATDRRSVGDLKLCRDCLQPLQLVGDQSLTSRQPVGDHQKPFYDRFGRREVSLAATKTSLRPNRPCNLLQPVGDQSPTSLQPPCNLPATTRNFGRKEVADRLQAMCDRGFNTLRPRQNGRHLADNIFKCIFLNENVWIPIEISLKFVPKGPIDNIPALV